MGSIFGWAGRLLSCAVIGLVASAVSAAPITLLRDDREIRTDADWSYSGTDTSASGGEDDAQQSIRIGGPFVASSQSVAGPGFHAGPARAEASQDSTLSVSRFAGNGLVRGSGDYVSRSGGDPDDVISYYRYTDRTTADASSIYLTRFQVDERTPYSVVGSFLTTGYGLQHESIRHEISLIRSGTSFPVFFGSDGLGRGFEFSDEGILRPGEYTLLVSSSISGYSGAEREASFTFEMVVPEPGTGLLLGCGVALLAHRRRALSR